MSDNRLPELVSQIKNKLSEAFRALKRNLEFYREAGRLLRKAKKELKAYSRRPWKAWLMSADGPGIEPRVAQFYMQLDANWDKIQKHPDFTPEKGYLAALKLVRKSKKGQKAKGDCRTGCIHVGGVEASSIQAVESEDAPLPLVLPMSLSSPEGGNFPQKTAMVLSSTEARDFPQKTTMPLSSGEAETLPEQPPMALPAPTTETAPLSNAFVVTASIVGDAELAVTPNLGFDIPQVLDLVRKGEAVVQEQSDTITLHDATVVARFKVIRHRYNLKDLTYSSQAA